MLATPSGNVAFYATNSRGLPHNNQCLQVISKTTLFKVEINAMQLSLKSFAFAAISSLAIAITGCSSSSSNTAENTVTISGKVISGVDSTALPIQGASVSIYQAQSNESNLLATTTTDASGKFSIAIPTDNSGNVYYAVANSGPNVQLMALLGKAPASTVTINEMTTVASAYAMSQFNLNGSISGPQLSLQIASDMAENLVAAATGEPSTLIQLPPNANQTNTWRELGTLSNILTACVRSYSGACNTLYEKSPSISGVLPTNTFQAITNIARNPGANVAALFAMGNTIHAFTPYLLSTQGPGATDLTQKLDAWTLAVKFNNTGSALYPWGGPANPVFDKNGYAWIGNNVIQGTGNSTNCIVVLKPNGQPSDGKNGTPVSPICNTGGILGSGYGITMDPTGNLWEGNFGWGEPSYIPGNPGQQPAGGSITQLNPQGIALSPDKGWVSGTLRPQGMASDSEGNIWIASYGNSSVVVFPKGDPAQAISYAGNAGGNANESPFGLAIDSEGSAWVSYTKSSTIMKYRLEGNSIVAKLGPIALPSGSSLKGVAVDQKGNAWIAAGSTNYVYAFDSNGSPLPGSPYSPYTGGGIGGAWGPWGISIDAKGNVWVATFGAISALTQTGKYGVMQLCGATVSNCPAGSSIGSPISPLVGYTLPSGGDPVLLSDGSPIYDDPAALINSRKPLMRQTNAQSDVAGNVWVMNNWKPSVVQDLIGDGTLSDPNGNPGGDGVVIFVGLGAPTKGPLIGPTKAP